MTLLPWPLTLVIVLGIASATLIVPDPAFGNDPFRDALQDRLKETPKSSAPSKPKRPGPASTRPIQVPPPDADLGAESAADSEDPGGSSQSEPSASTED